MKKFVMFLVLVFCFAFLAEAKPIKKVSPQKKVEKVEVRKDNDLAEFKEEINMALANLNEKIASTNEKFGKGATVNGEVFFSYLIKDLKSPSSSVNAFDVSRVYIDVKKSLSRNASARVTTDVLRETTAKQLDFYLKYAYFSLDDLGVPYIGLQNAIFGQQATHWIDFMQKYWRFRYVAKTLTDHYSLFSSADIGIGLKGAWNFSALQIPGLPNLEYHAILVNGEGYKAGESSSNPGKDLAVTLKTTPLWFDVKDLVTVAIGGMIEDISLSKFDFSAPKKDFTAMLAYEFTRHGEGVVFAEYACQDASTYGASLGGQIGLIADVNLLVRYDSYKKAKVDYIQYIGGLEYLWGSNIRLALDYQHELKGSADNSKKLSLHTSVKW